MTDRLAINGGTPLFPEGPPGWPVDEGEVREVLTRLAADGGWGRYHGPHGEALCAAIAQFIGLEHVRLYASGTIAVEAALRAVGVEAGDRVLLAGYDFPGNFRAIEAIGARPVLVDPSPDNWSFTPEAFESAARFQPKAAIVSHLHGGLAPMSEICRRAAELGVAIVEDACQAHGATVGGRPAGSWGDVGVWSFGGSKLLTAGRGGALFTANEQFAQRARLFSERGNDAFPLSEMQAAILLPQLEKLPERNERRRRAVDRLLAAGSGLTGLRAVKLDEQGPAFYKLAFAIDAPQRREPFLAAMQAEGVALNEGFRGFTRRGKTRCDHAGRLDASEQLVAQTMVLHHPILLESDETIDRLAMAFRRVVQDPGP